MSKIFYFIHKWRLIKQFWGNVMTEVNVLSVLLDGWRRKHLRYSYTYGVFILSCPCKAAVIKFLQQSSLNPPTVLPCGFSLPYFFFLEISLSAVNVRLLRDEAYLQRDTLKQTPCIDQFTPQYRVSQEECAILRESVPYVKLYRYNPKHLYPKLNGYGDNGQRKVWAPGVSTYCTPSVTSYSSNAHARQRELVIQWPWQTFYSTVALTSQDNAVCVKYLEAQGQIRQKCECFCSSI